MKNLYDEKPFFDAYAEMARSKDGLKAAGEWPQLEPLFPNVRGKRGFDLCALYHNAMEVSRRLKPEIPMIGENGIPLRHEPELEKLL